MTYGNIISHFVEVANDVLWHGVNEDTLSEAINYHAFYPLAFVNLKYIS